tara:strand:+ start:822 stop:2072 length:1251 start_codon:yes stop_codon:yes gene_type:complete
MYIDFIVLLSCKVLVDMSLKKLSRNVAIITPENGLDGKLKEARKGNRPLIVKLGFDPTAPDLHLGHAVVLRKLRDFQEEGHSISVIIGDFTALIGDPTGRNKMRPPLSEIQVKMNAETYISQLAKVINISQVNVQHNSSWLGKMNFSDVVKLMSNMTLAQMMQREDFSKRYKDNTPINLHELTYPLMQGYDSVEIQADIEIGGTDQLFNCMVGRSLQDAKGLSSQVVVSMPLLVGLDGVDKMSKSKNNYVGLTDKPEDMYGKIMSIPDTLIVNYLELTTSFSDDDKDIYSSKFERNEIHPMELKKRIAFDVVDQYYDEDQASLAQEYFESNVQNKSEIKYDVIDVKECFMDLDTVTLFQLCKLAKPNSSNKDVKRLIAQGGVSVDGDKLLDENYILSTTKNIKLKIGKRGYFLFES